VICHFKFILKIKIEISFLLAKLTNYLLIHNIIKMATNNIKFSIAQDCEQPCRIEETPEHLKLKDLLLAFPFPDDMSVHLKQEKVPFGYWSKIPPQGPLGPAGCRGCAKCQGFTLADTRPLIDPKELASHIVMVIPNSKKAMVTNALFGAKIALGPRHNDYATLFFDDIRLNKSIEFGVYKREGFDELYNNYKKIDPAITELQFASFGVNTDHDEYNTKLVDVKPIFDDLRPALTYFQVTKTFPSNFSEMKIVIHNVDLAANMDRLHKVLSLLQ